ncbi:MAG TPA: pantoate--beta-alanine ligase [Acidimicrobiales bacterium]|jgi:pantoate--beta-alanine ligase|nr:pantoate--beta-alanine ligase [Acidimicrobiales bacterium]
MTSTLLPDLATPRLHTVRYRPPSGSDVRIIESIAECAAALDAARAAGRTVGLVPTMGALHAGHCSLVARAAAECDVVVVTVFVNPLQFGDPEDIANYPRTLDADVELAGAAGAGIVFAPPVSEMYPGFPAPVATTISVAGLGDEWEGSSRPGHFDGVSTVVAKLFAMAGRCRAFFGEKDFQQLAVVRRMVRDLSLPVEIVGCPTVRDDDGLALSSRNVRLSPEHRQAALALSRALRAGARTATTGAGPAEIEATMAEVVATEPAVSLDYAALVRADDLKRPPSVRPDSSVRLLIAAIVGGVRLIDNLDPFSPSPDAGAGPTLLSASGSPAKGNY